MSGYTMEEFSLPQGPPKVFVPVLPDGYVPPTQEAEASKKEKEAKQEDFILSDDQCKELLAASKFLDEELAKAKAKKSASTADSAPFEESWLNWLLPCTCWTRSPDVHVRPAKARHVSP
ncbi:unnamed protein product [Cladocopium goreaui]|uniref:Uncharacterized protein n=1 Tax=Cladocopium goreaui TaxID=2562237 RepID=A0A9P1DUF2_9DINO|nr:unnamed protein product [Cladocopium goreaui]|mmetsp:Transcript_69997/g.154316  ORF Transcript_69997/g.154316 Transcript_69997/m.154316 type:complete len:119 (-) Transcript_69997:65-421(-)